MFDEILNKIRQCFPAKEFIPLHEPSFFGNEKEYLNDCIDSTFVSSVGKYVDKLEEEICTFTKSKYAVAVVNGTSALHLALVVSGVKENDEVLTQALSFIATSNAISYCNAKPVYIDVDSTTLGLSPDYLSSFLNEHAEIKNDGYAYNKTSNRRISACVPMHTFGHPCEIDSINEICKAWNISLIEDAAESMGSYFKGVHTGCFGNVGIISFNGNKTITSGGGGVMLFQDKELALKAKHLSTQAKVNHPWEYAHDSLGFNYRMPNINAALACAQLESLPIILDSKRELAKQYAQLFEPMAPIFVSEPKNCRSNFWLNSLLFEDIKERNAFLSYANSNGVMSRPAWELNHTQQMFTSCQHDGLKNSKDIANRLVNIPSSYRQK